MFLVKGGRTMVRGYLNRVPTLSSENVMPLKEVFRKHCNKKKRLDRAAFVKALVEGKLVASERIAGELFDHFDRDGDGSVDAREFMLAAHSLSGEAISQEEQWRIQYNIWDLDGDGKLSRDEVAAILSNGDISDSVDAILQDFEKLDIDGDGVVSEEEFVQVMKGLEHRLEMSSLADQIASDSRTLAPTLALLESLPPRALAHPHDPSTFEAETLDDSCDLTEPARSFVRYYRHEHRRNHLIIEDYTVGERVAAAKHGVTSSAVSISPASSGESIAAIIVWHAGTVRPDDPQSLRDYVAELQFKKTIRATSSSTAQDVLQAACKKLQLDPAGHCLVASYMSDDVVRVLESEDVPIKAMEKAPAGTVRVALLNRETLNKIDSGGTSRKARQPILMEASKAVRRSSMLDRARALQVPRQFKRVCRNHSLITSTWALSDDMHQLVGRDKRKNLLVPLSDIDSILIGHNSRKVRTMAPAQEDDVEGLVVRATSQGRRRSGTKDRFLERMEVITLVIRYGKPVTLLVPKEMCADYVYRLGTIANVWRAENRIETEIKHIYTFLARAADQGDSAVQEARNLLQYMNMGEADTAAAMLQFQAQRNTEQLDYEDWREFILRLAHHEEVDELYAVLCSRCGRGTKHLPAEEFNNFLRDIQMEGSTAEHVLPHVEEDRKVVTKEEFYGYICGDRNDWSKEEDLQPWQDMSCELPKYFIMSSHNTYLESDQVYGTSTVDAYKRALLNCCRCVELDCWDGPDGDPIITHGGTLTSVIKVREACTAIRSYAFVSSDYPLILSLEMHCSEVQQEATARIMLDSFGSMLPPLFEDGQLFTPGSLRWKILIKGKRGGGVHPLLASITHLPTSSAPSTPYGIRSRSERELDLNKSASLVEEHMNVLTRVYPKGSRMRSSNYDPTPFWNAGAQIVALNLQTWDDANIANWARFRCNGSCGWVLKPKIMRSPIKTALGKPFDPLENDREQWAPPNCAFVWVTIRVHSGRFLQLHNRLGSQKTVAPLLIVKVDGNVADKQALVGVDCDARATGSINGVNPRFYNMAFRIPIVFDEMAVLRFEVRAGATHGPIMGCTGLPLLAIREGYRTVNLRSPRGLRQQGMSLLVYIQFDRERALL